MTETAEQRVVCITGAAGGLGQALVSAFAASGWQVVATWHRTPLPTVPENVWPVPLDVTCSAAVEQTLAEMDRRFGRLDALVNNAGVARDALVAHMSLPAWHQVVDVNLRGAMLCSRGALTPMLRRRSGHILNIASFGGRIGRAGQANYAASKAGLIGLTQAMAKEVGGRNVQVNAILPGFLLTPLVGSLSEGQLAAHVASNALGRLGDPAEVARFAVFLAGMSNVSGQVFQLDSRIGPWS